MNTTHSDGTAVRPQRPQKMSHVLALSVGAILLVLTAACTTEGQASPQEFRAATTLPGARSATTLVDADACTHVDAPMLDIPNASDSEPQLRIPQPPGWERTTS